MKKKILSLMLCGMMAMGVMAGCGSAGKKSADKKSGSKDGTITVGFSQVGAESDWRTANTKSMKETFSEANGYPNFITTGN